MQRGVRVDSQDGPAAVALEQLREHLHGAQLHGGFLIAEAARHHRCQRVYRSDRDLRAKKGTERKEWPRVGGCSGQRSCASCMRSCLNQGEGHCQTYALLVIWRRQKKNMLRLATHPDSFAETWVPHRLAASWRVTACQMADGNMAILLEATFATRRGRWVRRGI
eukprot:357881-Chlamydomonas_euryale.AAC.9